MNTHLLTSNMEAGGIERAGFGQVVGMLVSQTKNMGLGHNCLAKSEVISFKPEVVQDFEIEQSQLLIGWSGGSDTNEWEDNSKKSWEDSKNVFSYSPYTSRAKFLNSPYKGFEGSDILY